MDRQQLDPITVNAIVDEALSKVDWTNRETLDIIVTIEMRPASLSLVEAASKHIDRPWLSPNDGSASKYAGTLTVAAPEVGILTSQDIQDIKEMKRS